MKGGGTIKYGILNNVYYSYKGDYNLETKTPHGKGIQYLKQSQQSYSGDFVNGVREGKGIMTWPYKGKYVGNWRNGQPHGKGKYYDSKSEELYSGDFVKGSREGKGIIRLKYGTKFDGIWKNDNPTDDGSSIRLTNGKRIRGNYADALAVEKDDRISQATTPQVARRDNHANDDDIVFINDDGDGNGDGDFGDDGES